MSTTKQTNIHSKLLKFQSKGVSIKKGKTNPHFKNKYADINEVLDKVKPVLSELGIVAIQIPQEEGLKTILHDTDSGTEVESFLRYSNASDAQKLGANITYLRRYSLVSMLCLEDDDDDGNTASRPAPAMTLDQAFAALRKAKTVNELNSTFTKLPPNLRKDDEVIAVAKEVKADITSDGDIDV